MAELKLTIGPLIGSQTATDANAARWLEGFLRGYCQDHQIDYETLTNQQRVNLYIKIIVDYTLVESFRYWRSEAINDALESLITDPVIFK